MRRIQKLILSFGLTMAVSGIGLTGTAAGPADPPSGGTKLTQPPAPPREDPAKAQDSDKTKTPDKPQEPDKSKESQPAAPVAPTPAPTQPAGTPPPAAAPAPAPPAEKPKEAGNFRKYLQENQLPSTLTGKAKLIIQKDLQPEGKLYTFPVLVDLTNVAIEIQGKEKVKGVLGAYTLGVKFDPAKVKLVDIHGGQTTEFAKKPVFTNLEKANAEGLVRFSSVHTTARTPTGLISLARVVLEVSDPQALGSIDVYGDSLSTSIIFYPDKKLVGPFSIPFEGNRLPRRTVSPAGRATGSIKPVPAHSTQPASGNPGPVPPVKPTEPKPPETAPEKK